MDDSVQREVELPVDCDEAWAAVVEGDWLGEEASLELAPGGEARFVVDGEERGGWVEEVVPLERLVFWWGDPASRVEVELEPAGAGTRVRVTESRPLEVLAVIGMPLDRGERWDRGERGAAGPMLLAA
jgi:uncharacterized protein YndB with AHSA1/START domain